MKQNVKIVCILLELTCCALALPLLVVKNVKTHHSLIGLGGASESHLPHVGLPWFKPEEELSERWAQSRQPSRESFTLHPAAGAAVGQAPQPHQDVEMQRLNSRDSGSSWVQDRRSLRAESSFGDMLSVLLINMETSGIVRLYC